jgi:hypothetical protein
MSTETLLTPSGEIDRAAIADKAAAWAAQRTTTIEGYRKAYLVALDAFNMEAGIEWGWHHRPEMMAAVSRSVCTKGD